MSDGRTRGAESCALSFRGSVLGIKRDLGSTTNNASCFNDEYVAVCVSVLLCGPQRNDHQGFATSLEEEDP